MITTEKLYWPAVSRRRNAVTILLYDGNTLALVDHKTHFFGTDDEAVEAATNIANDFDDGTEYDAIYTMLNNLK